MGVNKTKLMVISFLVLGIVISSTAAIARAEEGLADLRKTSRAFSSVARKAIPAVVSVRTVKIVRRPSVFGHEDKLYEEFLERFFGPGHRQRSPKKEKRSGQGSGFIISPDGYVLTNNHVVEGVDELKVTLHDGRDFNAEVIGTDPKTEVALLKIDGKDLPAIELGDSDEIDIGEWVIAVGNPFGLTETVTVGVVSAKGRGGFGLAKEAYEDFIQTDAAINPGNSGGPLLNVQGKAIGINTFIVSGSGGYMGIGFAVPINMAKAVRKQLIKSGKVTRGFLGIYMDEVTPGLAEYFDLKKPQGIIVTDIIKDSPAEKANLKKEDIILKINGKDVENRRGLRNTIAFIEPGTKVNLLVFRDGKELRIEVRIDSKPEIEPVAGMSELAEKLGLQVQELTKDLADRFGYELQEGVLVAAVTTQSPAFEAGIRPGMLILSVNRKDINSVSQFNDALKKAAEDKKVLLRLRNERYTWYKILHWD